jgi:hypothetical protein
MQEKSYPSGTLMSAQQTMFRVLRDMGLSDTQEVANTELWMTWVFEAQREMRLAVTATTERVVIPVENCVAQKPFGYLATLDLFIGDEHHAYIIPRLRRRGEFQGLSPAYYSAPIEWTVESTATSFLTSSEIDGRFLHLTYRALSLADDLTPVVDANYYTAILAYCRMKWIGRSRAQGERTYSPSDEQQSRITWVREYRRNRASDTMDQLNETTISQMMAVYNDPLFRSSNPEARRVRLKNLLRLTEGQPGLGDNQGYPYNGQGYLR